MSCEYQGNGMREAIVAVAVGVAVVLAPALAALAYLAVTR